MCYQLRSRKVDAQSVIRGAIRKFCILAVKKLTYYITHTVIFTTRCYASVVLAMGLCPCLSVSVTSRSSTNMAKQRITQTTPHDSPGTLVFWCQRSPRNSTVVTPFYTAIHSVITGEPRDFNFGTLTYHSKSHPTDEKYSLKGAWSGSGEPV